MENSPDFIGGVVQQLAGVVDGLKVEAFNLQHRLPPNANRQRRDDE
jgi:hypothetical protein